MRDLLRDFLAEYLELTPDLYTQLDQSSLVQSYPRGTLVLRQGDEARRAFFVLRGCLRSFTLKNGEDKTLDFFIEEDPVLPLEFGTGEPSSHSLECMEDCMLVGHTREQEERMLAEYPQLKHVCLTLAEVMSAKLQGALSRYRSSTPEERYRDLVESRPDLLQRVPQYYIASYLGIRPESLSRIRRRISRGKFLR